MSRRESVTQLTLPGLVQGTFGGEQQVFEFDSQTGYDAKLEDAGRQAEQVSRDAQKGPTRPRMGGNIAAWTATDR